VDKTEHPSLLLEDTGGSFALRETVTTLGRGPGVDVDLGDPSVSRLHAEIVRRGPHAYIADMGLSTNGTLVNGRPVGRRVLADGDVVQLGTVRLRVVGLPPVADDAAPLRRTQSPELTRREKEVLEALCRPALVQEAFVAPATAHEVAEELVVTEAAVKQHLLRLYQKFKVEEGPNRRARLANEVISAGVVRPAPLLPAAGIRRVV
jgi:DNA-binding CsgD family transcriptional regulator